MQLIQSTKCPIFITTCLYLHITNIYLFYYQFISCFSHFFCLHFLFNILKIVGCGPISLLKSVVGVAFIYRFELGFHKTNMQPVSYSVFHKEMYSSMYSVSVMDALLLVQMLHLSVKILQSSNVSASITIKSLHFFLK